MSIAATHAGCLLPSPLHPAEQEFNHPPSLTRAVPGFGPIIRSDATFDLQVFAVDPNIDDQLRIRLFIGQSYTATITEIPLLSTNNPDNPYERTGHLPTLAYCAVAGLGPGEYVVVVADRDFSMTPGMLNKAPGGETNENRWTLSCNGMSQ